MKNGEPWFIGKDVAEILGYKDTVNALRTHVDDEEKLTWQITTSGQSRNMTIINESGLYSLIFGSKLPKSKEFKRWVTSDVLPSIRKSGNYILPINKSNAQEFMIQQGVEFINQLTQGFQTMFTGMQEYIKDSIIAKDKQIEDIRDLVGFRSKNIRNLSDDLKVKLSLLSNKEITAKSIIYKKIMNRIFRDYRCFKWEEIPTFEYNRVYSYIDSLEFDDLVS